MIKGKVEAKGCYFFNYLESGEAVVYSNPSQGGDGSHQWFPTHKEAQEVLGWKDAVGPESCQGVGEIEEAFVEKIRSAPGHKYYSLGGPWPEIADEATKKLFERDRSKDN